MDLFITFVYVALPKKVIGFVYCSLKFRKLCVSSRE